MSRSILFIHGKVVVSHDAFFIYTMGREIIFTFRGIICNIPRKMENLFKCVVYFVIYPTTQKSKPSELKAKVRFKTSIQRCNIIIPITH